MLTNRMVDMGSGCRQGRDMSTESIAVGKANGSGGVGGWMRSLYQVLANRRKFERVPISGTVRTVTPGSAMDVMHVCSCVDISPRGMAIDSPEPLALDVVVPIQAEGEGSRRFARVCYCLDRGIGYRIGLEFIAGNGKRANV